MKKSLIIVFITTIFLSCDRREVDLSQNDILTLGNEREWKLAELNIFGVDQVATEACYSDDTVLFQKANLAANRKENVYIWKKGRLACEDSEGQNVDLQMYFRIAPNGTEIIFAPLENPDFEQSADIWIIKKLTHQEVIFTTGSSSDLSSYRLLRLTPKITSSQENQ